MDFTTLLLRLLIAHVVGDFVLQRARWVEERRARRWRSVWLYAHGAVHAGLAWIAFASPHHAGAIAVVVIVHLATDLLEPQRDRGAKGLHWLLLDQLVHGVVLAFLAAASTGLDLVAVVRERCDDAAILVVVLAILVLTIPTGTFIATFARRWEKELQGNEDNLPGAGMWIGVIERLLILLFVMQGVFEAVGFLLAAKSVFRFGDLKESAERRRTEYVMIGTLLSFAIAIAVALSARAVARGG
jgi:hypothetical protein